MSFPFNILLVLLALAGCASATPAVGTHTLAACPASPNCVSSLASDAGHFIEPFNCSLPPAAARTALIRAVSMLEGGRVVVSEGNYLRAEFVSSFFKFVDDVEFVIDEEKKIINLRSASRVGYSDFGVNRRRIETLRKSFINVMTQLESR
ncbi:MAG: DUF1499 domain-containing protein [Deltaproteobacteria bacterium]|nr:DUF1499 domain-containing protein [Deltaproteobacteria bacterium]